MNSGNVVSLWLAVVTWNNVPHPALRSVPPHLDQVLHQVGHPAVLPADLQVEEGYSGVVTGEGNVPHVEIAVRHHGLLVLAESCIQSAASECERPDTTMWIVDHVDHVDHLDCGPSGPNKYADLPRGCLKVCGSSPVGYLQLPADV